MSHARLENLGTATFKIVGAPHMTPTISTSPNSGSRRARHVGPEMRLSLGNIVTWSHG